MTEQAHRGERWLIRILFALPFVGAAVGPVTVGGEAHWLIKSIVGLLLGAAFSAIGFKGKFVPPLSTCLAALAAVLIFASVAVIAIASPYDRGSAIILAAAIAAAMFWALTR